MKQTLWAQDKILLFTHTGNKYGFTRHLKQNLAGQDDKKLFAFADTDHALEWCEDKLLAQRVPEQTHTIHVELADQNLCQGMGTADLQQLQTIVKPVTYKQGETIFHCRDQAESLFLIIEGEVEVLLSTETAQHKRLAMLSPGMSFGEMALLNHRKRSADVSTTRQSRFYQIVFNEIPDEILVNLLTNFAQQLATKLGRETRELQHLD